VAIETAALRSERARQDRQRIQQQFGLKVSVSGRRFKVLQTNADRVADRLVPKIRRDWWAAVCTRTGSAAGWSILGLFLVGGRLFDGDTVAVLAAAAALIAAWAGLKKAATVLAGPRDQSVAEIADRLLRNDLSRVEAEQLEYLRFYTTPEWRAVRAFVIRRDGRLCRRCSRLIAETRDLTVDHVKPRSRFPELALDVANLQILCRSCNASKGATVPEPELSLN
jgi:hypothetical protein